MVMNKDNIVQTSRANLLPAAHTEIPIIIQSSRNLRLEEMTSQIVTTLLLSSNMKTMLGGPASVSEYNQLSEV